MNGLTSWPGGVKQVVGAVCVALFLSGCAVNSYDVKLWGSMGQVLREGHTEGRVGLAAFDGVDGTFAVGAIEELSGEVLVEDGNVWLSRVDDSGIAVTTLGVSSEDRATLLAVARVARWQATPIIATVAPSATEQFLLRAARAAGFDTGGPIPFMVVGTLLELDLHVIAGACPMAASHGGTVSKMRPPFRNSWDVSPGKLVGFLAEGLEGSLTHHGSKMHSHALLDSNPPLMGHVDRVGFAAGGVLYLPDR